jgi:RimJ/RimL family protein N-acetyltransferase
MLEPYRPEYFPQVERFARRLGNFDYVKTIIRLHVEEHRPGGCFVWKVGKRIAAFCAVSYLNRDDAWLCGMRVDREFHNHGVATKATRQLMAIARRDGRTWVGLNTSDTPGHRPVFRICEKLGMRLEDIYANDIFWRLRQRFPEPRLVRFPGIYEQFRQAGRRVFFHETPGWFWSRVRPGRARWLNSGGYLLQGMPVHINRQAHPKGERQITISLLQEPSDPGRLFRSLLAMAQGKRWMVVNYPAEWKRRIRPAWRAISPSLRPGHHCFPATERVYGREL